jgi:proliferating cell nuclear antigen
MDYLLEIRTVQSSVIKTLVEALKELLTDVVLEVDETGLRVIAMNKACAVLVHLKLDATRFELFRCSRPLNIGINIINLHKLIKTVGNSDTLTLYVEEGEGHLGIKIDSSEKNSRTVYHLNLLDMENTKITVSPMQFDDVIVLTSTEFQKLCRDMHNIADVVEIKVVNGEVTFSCRGDFSTQETVLGNGCLQKVAPEEKEDGGNTTDPDAHSSITQGMFNLDYLVMFTRCTNLSPTVQLYLKNDFPLFVRYTVSNLGEIKLVCAPQSQQ